MVLPGINEIVLGTHRPIKGFNSHFTLYLYSVINGLSQKSEVSVSNCQSFISCTPLHRLRREFEFHSDVNKEIAE
jgi:hypothetical protein